MSTILAGHLQPCLSLPQEVVLRLSEALLVQVNALSRTQHMRPEGACTQAGYRRLSRVRPGSHSVLA